MIKIFEIVVISFLLYNNTKKVKFFEKKYLLANTSINIILEIFFFISLDVNI